LEIEFDGPELSTIKPYPYQPICDLAASANLFFDINLPDTNAPAKRNRSPTVE
jgi:hypothetical protein